MVLFMVYYFVETEQECFDLLKNVTYFQRLRWTNGSATFRVDIETIRASCRDYFTEIIRRRFQEQLFISGENKNNQFLMKKLKKTDSLINSK